MPPEEEIQTCEVRWPGWPGHRATSADPSIPEGGSQMIQTSEYLVLWNPSVGKALSILSHCSLSISIHRPVYKMHVSHLNMRKPLHVHCRCHKVVKIVTKSVCFQADLRAVLNVSTHSQSATLTQQLTSAPLTKCYLTLQVDFRDLMFLIEIYLFWCSLPLVLIWTSSFGTGCIYIYIYIYIYISVICPRAGPSLQTQAPRLQLCSKAGLPLQTQEPRLQFY